MLTAIAIVKKSLPLSFLWRLKVWGRNKVAVYFDPEQINQGHSQIGQPDFAYVRKQES